MGAGLVDLAEQYLSRHPVRAVAAPYLVDLRNTTGAGVLLGVRRGDRLVVLDKGRITHMGRRDDVLKAVTNPQKAA